MPIVASERSQPAIDEVKREALVREFRAALVDADVDEKARAALVYAVHRKVCTDWDLYEEVMRVLGNKLKYAIRDYIESYQDSLKRKAPKYEDLPERWRPELVESRERAFRLAEGKAIRARDNRAKTNAKP
jgi:hypothetical protein